MEKYGTYKVYKNKDTGEIRRYLNDEYKEFIKNASVDQWIELDHDPGDDSVE